MKKIEKRYIGKRMGLAGLIVIVALSMCSCGSKETVVVEKQKVKQEKTKAETKKEYLEKTYGIADPITYGKRIGHTEADRTVYDEKFTEDSHGGIVLYKNLTSEGETEGQVCIYLSDSEYNGIALVEQYIYNMDGSGTGTGVNLLARPKTKNNCYVRVGSNYFICVEQEEEKDVTGNLTYTENITAYKLARRNSKSIYTISRKMTFGTSLLKEYKIQTESDYIIYAEGYTSYTADGAQFVSTEQEFCDKANTLISNMAGDDIRIVEASWDNRWNSVSIDESQNKDDVVKVSMSSSEPYIDENGDEIKDIVIRVNDDENAEEATE